jgi:hypothetical protein
MADKYQYQKWIKLEDGPWKPVDESCVYSEGYKEYWTPQGKHPSEIIKLEEGRNG